MMNNKNNFKYVVYYTFGGEREEFSIEEGFIGNEIDALEFFKDEVHSDTDAYVWENDGYSSFDLWFENLYEGCGVEKIDLEEEKEAREEHERQKEEAREDQREANYFTYNSSTTYEMEKEARKEHKRQIKFSKEEQNEQN